MRTCTYHAHPPTYPKYRWQRVFPPDDALGGPGFFAHNPLAHLTEASDLATEESAAQLRAEWGAHWDESASWLLEKSPSSLLRTRFLQALFPDASFVVVLRHPIANAYATRAWGEAHGGKASLGREAAADFVEHWLAAHAILDADLPHLRRVRIVHLEELSAAPQATFDAICGDLGLPSHALPAAKVQSDVNRKYWHEYRKDAEDLRVRIAALAGAFAKFGYRLDDDGFGTVVAPYPAAEKAGLAPNGHAVDIGNGASNGCGTKRSAASASVPVPNGRAGKAAKVVGRAGTPLRPVIITFGTRGDVQPFIPLALEMQARGMKPVLVAHPVFRKLVEGAGVTFASLVADENAAPLADATECAAAG